MSDGPINEAIRSGVLAQLSESLEVLPDFSSRREMTIWSALIDAEIKNRGFAQELQAAVGCYSMSEGRNDAVVESLNAAESKLTALSAILEPLKGLHEECQPNGDRSPADVYYARMILRDRLFDALPELLRVMEGTK